MGKLSSLRSENDLIVEHVLGLFVQLLPVGVSATMRSRSLSSAE
jgi:hypothetical protein